MAPNIIVSYDDTANDRDALALGRLFAATGASVSLAYVRHTAEAEPEREALREGEAQQLLERGAEAFGDPDLRRHVVVSASTAEGLKALALRENADAIVFGSNYRTAPGNVRANRSAERLLHGGPVAVAIAPAGLRDRVSVKVDTIGLLAGDVDPAARETADELAARLDATVVQGGNRPIDLLVAASRSEAPHARVMPSAACEYAIETATCPVLVLPRGVALRYAQRLVTA